MTLKPGSTLLSATIGHSVTHLITGAPAISWVLFQTVLLTGICLWFIIEKEISEYD